MCILVDAVDFLRGRSDITRRVPDKVKLALWLGGTFLFIILGCFFFIVNFLGFLLICAVQRVSVLEVPDTFSFGFVVLELALEVDSVGVVPTALLDLTVCPVAGHLHASLLEKIGAGALFVARLTQPP